MGFLTGTDYESVVWRKMYAEQARDKTTKELRDICDDLHWRHTVEGASLCEDDALYWGAMHDELKRRED